MAPPDSAATDGNCPTMMDCTRCTCSDKTSIVAAGERAGLVAAMTDGQRASSMKASRCNARRPGGGRALSKAAGNSPFPFHRGSEKGEAQPSGTSSPEESMDEASNWTCGAETGDEAPLKLKEEPGMQGSAPGHRQPPGTEAPTSPQP